MCLLAKFEVLKYVIVHLRNNFCSLLEQSIYLLPPPCLPFLSSLSSSSLPSPLFSLPSPPLPSPPLPSPPLPSPPLPSPPPFPLFLFHSLRERIAMGRERLSAVVGQRDRHLTAYHEAGHAIVALFTPGTHEIYKATIVPRGHALGMVGLPAFLYLSIYLSKKHVYVII